MAVFSSVIYLCPLVGLVCGLVSFVSGRKHLLNTLLSLEFITLNIFWLIVLMISTVGGELYFSLFFLTMGACEGALGLAILVSMVRGHGSDNFSSFGLLQC